MNPPCFHDPVDRHRRAESKRPNILYIIVDDQSPFDFKFYNPQNQLNAPVIEKLAAERMVIDGAYHVVRGLAACARPPGT